jgi:HKD family nuclease
MARIELILQAVTASTHAEAIRALLRRVQPESVLISVAFVQEAGVEAVEEVLSQFADKTKLYIGIRNDITSIQGVKRLLALKAKIYAVDTAFRDTIFHPKLYLAVGKQNGGLIVGSANLTFQGLHNNIEASALITFDLNDRHDLDFIEQTNEAFDEMARRHPQHVFLIRDEKHAQELFVEGRLVDATLIPAPTPTSGVGKGKRDTLPRMSLARVARQRIRGEARQEPGMRPRPAPVPAPIPAVRTTEYLLVWESNELSRRDLNLPSGPNTNRTGSMELKKGAFEGIDHRHFFRDEIFKDLTWTRKANTPHLERARARVELIIKGLNYGEFKLRLTHNTDVNSKTYMQKNEMTHLHWDNAIDLVKQPDLLERKLYLYRKDVDPPEFLIEID